ncbi:nuclear transport factor 2 family protein [Rhodocaloribacter sp.]
MSQSPNNLDLIRAAYAAFARGDVPAVLGLMDENIAWREAEGFPYGGLYHGPEAVLNNVFMKLGTEWEGYRAKPEEFIDGGDTCVVLGTYSGTWLATGKRMEAPFAHVWKMRDGKAYAFRQYTDTVLVQRALEA